MMSADLAPVVLTPGMCELVICNLGPSVARNITVAFDPPLPEGGPAGDTMAVFLRARYANVIPTLPPRRRLRNVYQSVRDGQTGASLPDAFSVIFTYEDAHGHKYRDRYELTVNTLMNATSSAPADEGDQDLKVRLVKAVEQAARALS